MKEVSKDQLFEIIHQEFLCRGVLGKALRLKQGDSLFSVRCDEDCFTVYQINQASHLPPGLPGCVTLRLSKDECFSLPCGRAPSTDDKHLDQARLWANQMLTLLDATFPRKG
ncbi:hypothetical protein [Dethiosulfatarculus sandiegensis]|uniref:Uncharacterized protein n=1 Tax=Dethiosulfatarculus sandiegensis TaxID=1429043 RepID=A0A0D2J5N5_9BACT|nr:hypothetical protein [Dethiosulfatarculus sandiegensis]KIX13429.1 hypothetical protein X474_14345 [Dethiosulfatarculus sandiegensis]